MKILAMKQLLIVLVLTRTLFISSRAQVRDSVICFPLTQIDSVMTAIGSCLLADSLKTEIISQQDSIIKLKKLQLKVKQEENTLLKEGLEGATIKWDQALRDNKKLIERVEKERRRKWWFATGGAFAGLLTAILLI
jgi:precorrin-2 methylase